MDLLRRLFTAKAMAGVAAGATLLLAGCGSSPYIDSRREAGQKEPVGQSTPNLVSICYSSSGSSPDEIRKLAEPECAKTGRTAVLHHEDRWGCAMLTPRRIFFTCATKP